MSKTTFLLALCLLVLVASCATAAEGKGGIVPGLASCCLIGIPGGQLQNSGVAIPGRSWARILIIPAVIDGLKAMKGETAEEYAGIDSLPTTTEPGKGGLMPGLYSACCWTGIPAGHLINSGREVPSRAWLRLVPYVNGVVALYDGFKAFQGETMATYGSFDEIK